MSDDVDIRAGSGAPRRLRLGGRRPGTEAARRPRFRVGAVVAVAVAVGFVAWLVLRDDGGSSNARTQGAATAMKREAVNAEQQKGMEIVIARLKEQDAKIQKVNDKVELSKPAPRTVDNHQ